MNPNSSNPMIMTKVHQILRTYESIVVWIHVRKKCAISSNSISLTGNLDQDLEVYELRYFPLQNRAYPVWRLSHISNLNLLQQGEVPRVALCVYLVNLFPLAYGRARWFMHFFPVTSWIPSDSLEMNALLLGDMWGFIRASFL